MKRLLIVLALVAGCAGNPTVPEPQPQASSVTVPTPRATVGREGDAPPAREQVPAPTIPAGARFTIFCETFTGDNHVQRATELKNLLMANARTKGWYVIHQDGQSTIYHGYYAEFDESAAVNAAAKKEAQRAKSDKSVVDALPNPLRADSKLFPRALFVSLDSPDPDAPPEWSLVNANGYWSVEVASYTGFERKQAAVESVREARKANIPAFYYHGPSYSSVCIGAWPRSAVIERSTEQINSIPQGSDVFVDVRGGEIPADIRNNMLRDGKPIQVVVPKVEIVDKTLLATLKAYPEHAVDGYAEMEKFIDPATKKESMRPKHSMLVRIPVADGQTTAGPVDSAPEPSLIQPAPTNNLGARLRGLNQ